MGNRAKLSKRRRPFKMEDSDWGEAKAKEAKWRMPKCQVINKYFLLNS
jgi:hypothetical protein